LTYEAFIKRTASTPNEYILWSTQSRNDASRGWFGADDTNHFMTQIYPSLHHVDGTNPIPIDTWTHIAMVYDPYSQEMRYYLNGVLDTTEPFPISDIPDVSPYSLWLGSMRDSDGVTPWRSFEGYVDEFKIYNRVLTEDEIKEDYETGPECQISHLDLLAEIQDLKDIISSLTDRLNQLEAEQEALNYKIDNLPSGPKGEAGPQGPQGEPGTCTCTVNGVVDASKQFSQFNSFWLWYNNGMVCENGQTRCQDTVAQACVNYAWDAGTTCTYGCSAGACNPPPKDNCLTKPDTFSCSTSYSVKRDYTGCQFGHGTSTACDPGYCQYSTTRTWCTRGCDSLTGKCKA
jgi:hypothetical protein